MNPYEQAIEILGKTLSKFDDDDLIPCFGFGDGWSQSPYFVELFTCMKRLSFCFMLFVPVTTSDKAVFSFYPNEAPCKGFEGVLARYKEIVPYIHLAGTKRKKMYIRCVPVIFS